MRIDAGKEWVEVVSVPNAKTKRRFDFQWADWSYQTREVAGTLTGLIPGNTGKPLMDIVHPRETVFPGVDITLKNAFSSDEYRTVSDSIGAFLIAEVPDAVYILTIAGGMKSLTGIVDVTRQVLDVTHNATMAALPLRRKDTGCYRTEFQLSDRMMEGIIELSTETAYRFGFARKARNRRTVACKIAIPLNDQRSKLQNVRRLIATVAEDLNCCAFWASLKKPSKHAKWERLSVLGDRNIHINLLSRFKPQGSDWALFIEVRRHGDHQQGHVFPSR
jgi:hypothetical protein